MEVLVPVETQVEQSGVGAAPGMKEPLDTRKVEPAVATDYYIHLVCEVERELVLGTHKHLDMQYLRCALWDRLRSPVPSVQCTRASPLALTSSTFTLVSFVNVKLTVPTIVSP
ncbi:hypothetical protein EYF80_022790 [Liparis tanakae]|uniref:Uncharacterized protein n=1 Tax=Liparis tanakae TaxID=230148 RepID=A0A4Z2HMP1_9TELE|nr:hypothetical protein EYF80_022790 [Liparis tanakae]